MSKKTPKEIFDEEYSKLQSEHLEALCLLSQIRVDLNNITETVKKLNEQLNTINDEIEEDM